MNTSEILSLLHSDPIVKQILIGVFPIDKIPDTYHIPAAYVVNLDMHNQPGSHWVALYFNKNGNCEYFDSYGLEPPKVLKKFILKNAYSYTCNEKPVQQMLTSTCGQLCIYFLVWRSRNVPMKLIMSKLERNSADEFVTGFINKMFQVNTVEYDENFLVNQISRIYKTK